MTKIILASTSPRRKELLSELTSEFEIIPSNYEEDITLSLPLNDLAMTLSLGKAKDVAKDNRSKIVIGSDTFVVLNDKILGKPKSKEDAIAMLKEESGNLVEVYSGIAIVQGKKEVIDFDISKVFFKKLSDKEIIGYVNTGDPLDKSGSFGIQGEALNIIEKIEGDISTVIGLPQKLLKKRLKEFGVHL